VSAAGRTPLRLGDRLAAAHLPTPLERLERTGERLGIELWVKRDDVSGFALGGNKVRKLEFSLARALAEGARAVLTCGGADSNHCRATAFLARRVGLVPHLLLRTPDGKPAPFRGNTLLDAIAGAEIVWVTPEEYRTGAAMLAAHRARLEGRGSGPVFAIPEGASDPLGALGFAAAAEELAAQEERLDAPFATIVHAVGSGGTSAGLAAGRDALAAPWRVIGIPVCDDAEFFRRKVAAIRDGLSGAHGLPPAGARAARDLFLDGSVGLGYGRTTPGELRAYAALARAEGLLLDPCYTGKAFLGLERAVREGVIARGERVLFWHTGGGFANFSKGEEWGEALALAAR
jgi:D-cysteine desulfhydrase